MNQQDRIYFASSAAAQNWTKKQLAESDYLFGFETELEIVWAYAQEAQKIGPRAFAKKYSHFNLHPYFNFQ